MSEKFSTSQHEKQKSTDLKSAEHSQEIADKSREKARRSSHEHEKNIDKIRSSIEKESKSKEKDYPTEESSPDTSREKDNDRYVGKDLLDESYRRTLRRTRQQLSPPMRTLSKIIHNPIIETISEVGEKTIARPSGILMGGITACLGSGTLLWISKHYGYEYNFLMFALLFIAGFFTGLTIELLLRLTILKGK